MLWSSYMEALAFPFYWKELLDFIILNLNWLIMSENVMRWSIANQISNTYQTASCVRVKQSEKLDSETSTLLKPSHCSVSASVSSHYHFKKHTATSTRQISYHFVLYPNSGRQYKVLPCAKYWLSWLDRVKSDKNKTNRQIWTGNRDSKWIKLKRNLAISSNVWVGIYWHMPFGQYVSNFVGDVQKKEKLV